jgi:hypothetical protein
VLVEGEGGINNLISFSRSIETHVMSHSRRRSLADRCKTSDTKDCPQPQFQKEFISSVVFVLIVATCVFTF